MATIDMPAVGDRLRRLRDYHDLNSKEFADSVGIDPSSYSKIESGKKVLKADMAFAIAERWGVSMDFIYRGRLTELPRNLAEALMTSRTQGDR